MSGIQYPFSFSYTNIYETQIPHFPCSFRLSGDFSFVDPEVDPPKQWWHRCKVSHGVASKGRHQRLNTAAGLQSFTPLKTNMTLENQPLEDVSPII